MPNVVLLRAYVDFVSPQSLREVGREIASVCFGGGEFVGESEGIWDEIPAVRLDRDPLGLGIALGGAPGEAGGYTLEVSSRDPLGGPLPEDPESSMEAICDFSRYLAALVGRISGVEIRSPAAFGHMERNSEDESRLVEDLQRSWARGARPSELLRSLVAKGVVGGWMVDLMQRAFSLQLSKTNAISAWGRHGDDDRLDRFLTRFMPARDQQP